jgi:hypothetical protein
MAVRLLSFTANLLVSLISWGFPLIRGITSLTIIGALHPLFSSKAQDYPNTQRLFCAIIPYYQSATIILPIIGKFSQQAFYKEYQRIRLPA